MKRRWLPVIERIWRGYASLAGASIISLGIAYVVVMALAGDKAVVEPARNIKVEGLPVKVGDAFQYTYDFRRNEACPGDVVHIYTMLDVESPAIVHVRRAVQQLRVKDYTGEKRVVQLPEAVGPGRWGFQVGVDSRCPTRQRYDVIAQFEVEVIP